MKRTLHFNILMCKRWVLEQRPLRVFPKIFHTFKELAPSPTSQASHVLSDSIINSPINREKQWESPQCNTDKSEHFTSMLQFSKPFKYRHCKESLLTPCKKVRQYRFLYLFILPNHYLIITRIRNENLKEETLPLLSF